MNWYEIVELTCSILSAISLILSAFFIMVHFLKKLSVFTVAKDNIITIYACALHRQMIVTKIKVLNEDNEVLCENDFLIGGKKQLTLELQTNVPLKEVPFKGAAPKKIKVYLTLLKYGLKSYTCKIK